MLACMDSNLPTIPLSNLLIAFAPSLLLLGIMHRWSLRARTALYANARMLVVSVARLAVNTADPTGVYNFSDEPPPRSESVLYIPPRT